MHGANGSRMEKRFTSWKTDFTLETLLPLSNVTVFNVLQSIHGRLRTRNDDGCNYGQINGGMQLLRTFH